MTSSCRDALLLTTAGSSRFRGADADALAPRRVAMPRAGASRRSIGRVIHPALVSAALTLLRSLLLGSVLLAVAAFLRRH